VDDDGAKPNSMNNYDLDEWGWKERPRAKRSAAQISKDASDVLYSIAQETGNTKAQVDRLALHFVAAIVRDHRHEGEVLVGLLRRARKAMDKCWEDDPWPPPKS
jgi:hypothetical protein